MLLATLTVYVVALNSPSLRDMFDDRRVSGGVATLLYQALLRILLGTVLLEELAFRSVLPALAARRFGVARALRAVVGVVRPVARAARLEHRRRQPGRERLVRGRRAREPRWRSRGAVVGTAVAGLALCWLPVLDRQRARLDARPPLDQLRWDM